MDGQMFVIFIEIKTTYYKTFVFVLKSMSQARNFDKKNISDIYRISYKISRDFSKMLKHFTIFELEKCIFLNRSEFHQNLIGTIIKDLSLKHWCQQIAMYTIHFEAKLGS